MPSITTELGGSNLIDASQERKEQHIGKLHLKGSRWERPTSESRMMPTKLKEWWTSQREQDTEYYDLPTSSSISFDDSVHGSKFGLGSPTVPSPAESRSKPRQKESRIMPLVLVLIFFLISTATVFNALLTLPLHTVTSTGQGYTLPKTVSDVGSLAWALKSYAETGQSELLHVLAVLSLASVWTHAWSVPGSVLLNILTGALLPPALAILLQTTLTTIGSLISTILAAPLAPLLTHFFPSVTTLTRVALDGPTSKTTRSSAPWARLALLRLIGIVPWSSINLFAGLARPRLSLLQCAMGAFIGVLPWTAVTCQVGEILSSLTNSPLVQLSADGAVDTTAVASQTISSILSSREAMLKLLLLTLLSLAPILAKDKLQAWFNGDASTRSPRTERIHIRGAEAGHGRKAHQRRSYVEWWRRNASIGKVDDAQPLTVSTLEKSS